MFRKVALIILVGLGAALIGCVPATATPCPTFSGYGRYTLHVDCESVAIEEQSYSVTRHGTDLAIAGHTLSRGIYRKTRPWLYIHHIEGNSVDITFEEGSKSEYPLYTGSSASIFDVYAHPWSMSLSTNAQFANNYWLVLHRWSDTGVFFDLQHRTGDETEWVLAREDILIPSNGTEVTIAEITTTVKITSFDATAKTAEVQFTAP